MEKGFLDKVEDNAAVQAYLQKFKEIWDQWNEEVRQLFYSNYGDLPYLLDMKVDKRLFRALVYLVIFPKALGHIDEAVTDLFDRLGKRVTPVPAILVETFKSLNAYRRAGEATPRKDDISEEKRMVILQNLREEDVEWRAPWLLPDEILYRCGDFDWVPLLGI
ncbi:hypothetical protein Goshw_008564 [Gossypium schwendimanii]|uniref:Uncharacterized protein n=1 Tax=Gossypium schwendimanii TaxID=34291 RepID=A0A7J9N7Z9_GOSSC|nr:hypothetical protein [Gossypium schwendimanii]